MWRQRPVEDEIQSKIELIRTSILSARKIESIENTIQSHERAGTRLLFPSRQHAGAIKPPQYERIQGYKSQREVAVPRTYSELMGTPK
jgi:hypothetical protein